jgi:hypothetical protein
MVRRNNEQVAVESLRYGKKYGRINGSKESKAVLGS